MELPNTASGIATPKNLIGLSVVFLLAAAVFGVMNGQKTRSLRTTVVNAEAARDAIEKKRLDEQKEIKVREAAATQAATKAAEAETVANKIQSDLAQMQAEKADLQTKLQAAQAEVASIQHQTDQTTARKRLTAPIPARRPRRSYRPSSMKPASNWRTPSMRTLSSRRRSGEPRRKPIRSPRNGSAARQRSEEPASGAQSWP